jgi:hypothetical protein
MKKKYFSEEEKKEAKKLSVKKYYSTNRGTEVKRTYDKIYKAVNKEKLKEFQQTWRHSARGYASRFIERAKVVTPDTDLTINFLRDKVNKGNCELSGIPFQFVNSYEYFHNPYAPSIDRIDSSIGYYKKNVRIVLYWLNRAKGEFSDEIFKYLFSEVSGRIIGA